LPYDNALFGVQNRALDFRPAEVDADAPWRRHGLCLTSLAREGNPSFIADFRLIPKKKNNWQLEIGNRQ
jgi:hypothetical protein